ncbi:unnamed protein product [Mesocestoides corti]|uniref:DUF5736 domain-containing protein n=1 Tax=Mesocestoides corti TaxID=53468 RepID=A0A0R3UMD1_MESCO|nr:unnamed protein product [Mesocestoides corti]
MLNSRLREPAYCGLTENAPTDVPRRRLKPTTIKDRIASIVSIHIPSGSSNNDHFFRSKNSQWKVDLVEDYDFTNMNDHFGLLSLGKVEEQIGDNKSDLCHITKVFDRNTLFSSINDSLQDSTYKLDTSDCVLTCIASDSNFIYIAIQNLPFIFKIDLIPPNLICESPKEQRGMSVTKLHLRTSESTELIPSSICLRSVQGETKEVYVIGYSQTDNVSSHLLACFSTDGHLVAQTRKHSYRRYLALDVDTDGCLLMACSSDPENTSGVPLTTQICKLTPYFERRIFSITMRKGETHYFPEWITKSCARGQCWASVGRWDNASQTVSRRLFSFPGVQPKCEIDGNVRSPKEWLRVISWNFDSFPAGPIFALDSEHLLAIDTERTSLALIAWPMEQESANLQRLTKPSNRKIDHFCVSTTLNSTAFFSSGGDIFKFTFPEVAKPLQ